MPMTYDLQKYDFVNMELGKKKFVAVVIKKSKEKLIILPIRDFDNPEDIDSKKIMTGISVSKSSITAYHHLSSEQVENLLYLLNVNNTWIQRAIEKALK
jgi:hypothetical protein